ncbi:amidohydrolase family protein [Vibrio splendidus]|uniref:amidohydrolase family protein n=1 Tax=Vibrio splendidus TaxID=29497 RepID=UPI000CB5A8BF|nr:amidohydrolase family protein [Vibrio splendidus]PMI28468.1 2,3-dihydroxybenzoic acid decarboxylase [Vibrio splendidus]PMM33797.1 2,3-dihydroxybenzoic acid decarboxylase [Vibrio splendidus]PMO39217.1 2,3-dihydroxybenzoic acid decarboxylase [Vibrio splendidus]
MKYTSTRGTTSTGISRRNFVLGSTALGTTIASGAALASGSAMQGNPLWSKGNPSMLERDKDLFIIGLEEHWATPEMHSSKHLKFDIDDIGAGRIAHMDVANLNIQVLSALTPGAQNLPGEEGIQYARKLNDMIAKEVIPAYPDRFRAFAILPLRSPEAAADELERCITELGFVGAMTYGEINGKFLDDPEFSPVLARAEALNVPIYIHPNRASQQVLDTYYSNMNDPFSAAMLSGPGYGWHQEVALQCMRMIVQGTFDKYPNLQIIVGHMGEGLPFYYWRFGDDLTRATKGKLNKPIQQYINDNFWITTSAFFRDELLQLALSVMGEDRVMFATDYPFVSALEGTEWFRGVSLPRKTKEKIAYQNAQKLLGI